MLSFWAPDSLSLSFTQYASSKLFKVVYKLLTMNVFIHGTIAPCQTPRGRDTLGTEANSSLWAVVTEGGGRSGLEEEDLIVYPHI